MIGGKFMENVHRNPDQTWIYDYDANTWTHIDCETPDTFGGGGYLLIRMNKKQAIFAGAWCFHLDSLKWFRLAYPKYAPTLQIGENEGFAYVWLGDLYEARRIWESWIIRLNPDEPYTSPNFLLAERYNREILTLWGPSWVSWQQNLSNYINTFGGDRKVAFYDVAPDPYNYPKPQPQTSLYLDHNLDMYGYMLWKPFNPTNRSISPYMVLLCRNVLFGYGTRTGITEYDTTNGELNWYEICTGIRPGDRIETNAGFMAKLDEGIVMLSGDNKGDNSTWVFIMDDTSIPEINDDTLKLLTLGDDKYQIDGEIKNMKLYDLLGNFVRDYNDNYIDLNGLATGTYFLQYFRNNKQRAIKLLKK
jgi:hypothetical protein